MKYVLLLVALLGTNLAWADEACEHCTLDEVLVTASTIPTQYSRSGKSVDYLDKYLFDTQKPVMLEDALITDGLDVKSTGGLTSIQLRGNRSQDTRLIMEGAELRDPSEPTGGSASMLGDLIADGFEGVEVVKGASSTLYGSDGLGGSLALRPRKETYASFEYGNEGSFKESVGFAGYNVFVNASRLDSDDYENSQLNGGYEFNYGNLRLEPYIFVRQVESGVHDSPYLMGGQFFGDVKDPNDRREYQTYHFANKSTVVYEDYTLKNISSWTSQDRRFVYFMDEDGSDFPYDIEFRGDTAQTTTTLSKPLSENFTLSVGNKYSREFMEIEVRDINEDEADQYRNDVFSEVIFTKGILTLTGAVRGNFPEDVDAKMTYETTANVRVRPFRVHASFGTGYRNPSLYEQYGSLASSFGRFEIGNTELEPEESTSYDLGVEYSDELNTAGITYFHNNTENLIGFELLQYVNVDEDRTAQGIELYYERFLFGFLSARTGYTLTDTESLSLPEHKVYGSLSAIKGKWNGRFLVQWTDSKEYAIFNADTFLFENASEDGAINASLTVGYQVKENVEVYGRIENLFDDESTNDGFRQDGFGVFAGVKIKL